MQKEYNRKTRTNGQERVEKKQHGQGRVREAPCCQTKDKEGMAFPSTCIRYNTTETDAVNKGFQKIDTTRSFKLTRLMSNVDLRPRNGIGLSRADER